MCGKDEQQLDVFSYISPEQRVPQDHQLRSLRAITDEAPRELQPRFQQAVRQNRATVDSAGEVAASAPAAGVALGAQRTDVNGTTGLQPAVPLVRELEHG
jgi:hypothetical protein